MTNINTYSSHGIDEAKKHNSLDEDAHEHVSRLKEQYRHPETTSEHDRSNKAREAQSDALDSASTTEEIRHPHHEKSPAERRIGPVTKKQLKREFRHTMSHIQTEMSPSARTFSKFIHNEAVEKTSEFLAATIARPNSLLAGSMGAFVFMLALYLFAKSVGYKLSGFEPIAAFIVGWIAGLVYDYLRIMVTGKR